MEVERDKISVTVMYRAKKFSVEVPGDATVGLLGKQLSQATGVALSTMRLLVPKGNRLPAAAVLPASEPHSSSTLHASGITPGVLMRMMGASIEELKEVTQPVKEQRVLGFTEEENRQILRRQHVTQVRLPDGPYTFHAFRTLDMPFVPLSPPPEKALALMHKLASDPGIVAIMRKYKWQVGVMTELAPAGYVGISPKCLLGYNKNKGQEISLRLRTDDFKGFRKYESIKLTLLHELAHMVHDEHDENFHALDKQLNREVIELDWTHGTGHTLSGFGRAVDDHDEPMDAGGVTSGYKLGGGSVSVDARMAAVEAARMRFHRSRAAGLHVILNEPDPDDELLVIAQGTERDGWGPPTDNQNGKTEPDPDDERASAVIREEEPDPDDSQAKRGFKEPDPDEKPVVAAEPDPDESMNAEEPDPDESTLSEEPDPDESVNADEPVLDLAGVNEELIGIQAASAAAVGRLQNAVTTLRKQAFTTADTTAALSMLSLVVNNLINHPNDDKYKRLRKANPLFQDRLGRFKGAMEFVREVGFTEEGGEYVLKRPDLGLLFLARSVLERY